MQFDTKDYEKPLLIVGVLILVILVGYTAYNIGHNNAPVVTTVVTVTPTPTPVPTQPTQYWLYDQRITSMTTGSGPQFNVASGQGFYFQDYQDYYRFQPGDIVNIYVIGSTNPYGSPMFTAGTVVMVQKNYRWNSNTYYNRDDRYYDCGNAGCFYYDRNGKHAIN